MEADRDRPRGQVLPSHAQGPRRARGGNRQLGAPLRSHHPDSHDGGLTMSWWRRLLHSRRLEDALDKELRFHFETQVADYIRDGSSEAAARRRARLAFGGMDQIKEACRDARGTEWVPALGRDLAITLRGLRRSPGFAAAAIGTLSLALGATI